MRAMASAACVLAILTCARETAGPGPRGVLAVEPIFPQSQSLAAFNLAIDNIRLIVVRPPSEVVFDKTFPFAAQDTSLELSADIPLDQSPETFQVTIQMLSGNTLLFSGTQDVEVSADQSSPPAQIPVTYSGPGQDVATLSITPLDSVLSFNDPLTFQVTARDGQGAIVPSFYVAWATSAPSVAAIDATGRLVAPPQRASVVVTARTPITASQPNGVSASTPITFIPVPTSVALVGGCSQSGAPGTQLPLPFVVQVNAADNIGVPGVMVQFAVNSGGGAVTPASAMTDAQGRAQTLLTLGAGSGANVFQASVAGVATPVTCNASALGATQLAFAAQPTNGNVGVTLGTVVVEVRDATGSLVSTATNPVTLALGANPGSATLSGTLTVDAVAGKATFSDLSIDAVGNGYTLVASSAGLTSATSAPIDVTPIPGLHLAFTIQPGTVIAGQVMAPAVQVTAQDAQNNPVPSFTGDVALSLGSCPVGATLSGTSSRTAVAGVATFDDLSIDRAGGCTLVASSSGLQNVASTSFTIAPGPAAQLVFTVQPPASVAAGAVLVPAVRVAIEDALGNLVTTATNNVTVAFGANPGGAQLGGTLTRAAASGVAVFTDLTVSAAGTGYTLDATSGSLTPATSASFDVTAGAVSRFAVVVTPSLVTAGTAANVTVTAQDASGATVTGYLGTVRFTSSDAQATLPADYTFTTGDNGTHTFTGGVALKTAGSQSVTATDLSNGSINGAQSVSVSAAAATALFFTVQPSTTSIGAVITPPVEVTARDAFGNTATSFVDPVSVAIGNNPGSATLGGTAPVPATAGVATFSGLTLDQAGTGYTLTAAATGVTGATSNGFDITLVGATPNAWTAAAGGAWSVATNWSLGRVPQSTDSVVISLNGTYTVTLDTTISIAFLTFGGSSGAQTLAMSGRTLTVTSAATIATGAVATLNSGALAGPGALTNQGTLTLASSTINTALVNQGLLVIHGTNAIPGALTAAGGSTLRVEGSGTQGTATLTVANGFTNAGLIELTNNSLNQAATLAVTTGTLVNAGTLNVLANGGARTLAAELANQVSGTVTVSQAWTVNKAGAAHTNAGTIDVSGGDWTLNQSGTTPSFTNTGTVTIGTGRTWTTNGGTLNLSGGSVGGAGTLALSGLTANIATGFTNTTTSLTVTSSTLNGPGTLTNVASQTLTLVSSTIGATMPLVNQGTLVIHGTNAIAGALTAAGGSTLRVEGSGTQGTATLTVANGFTNAGLIELTNNSLNQAATLAVTTGTLVNAGTLNVLANGGARTLAAELANQVSGTVTVSQAWTVNKAGAAHTNAGTIDVSGGDWTLNQSGTTPSFTNTGTVTIGTGRTWTTNGGTLNLSGGSVGGAGTLALSGLTANIATGFTNTTTSLTVTSSTLNGPGTLTNVASQTLTLVSSTIGATMPLVNQGLLVIHGTNTIAGALTAAGGSTLRVEGSGTQGTATLTVANGFTNAGLIELTNNSLNQAATLAVTTGTLVNAGTINVLANGGARTLTAELANQAAGTVTVSQAWTVNKAGAAHTNAGTIDVSGGDWTLNQSGTTPSFTNTGTVTIGTGRTWTTNGGTLNLSGGSVGGAGTLALSGLTANIATGFTNTTTSLTVTSSTVNGPGTLTNVASQTLTLVSSTIGATMPLVNQGTLVIHGTNAINGALTAAGGSTLRVEGTGSQGTATLTVANGFTNAGLIELTNNSLNQAATLAVTNGTLANTGNINVLGSGGARTLGAQLDNQATGMLSVVSQSLTVNKAGAVHTNSGTIDVSGADWTLTQSGTTPSFTNTGTVTIGAARAWNVSGGTLNLSGGSVGGAGTLTLSGLTANVATGFTNTTTSLVVTSSTLNGPGTLTNAAARTLTLTSSTIGATMPLVNQGTLVIHGTNAINGALTAAGGSTLRVEGTGSQGTGTLTVANGFTNDGLIELANNSLNQAASLFVTNGTLSNADSIHVLGGGGARTLAAQLENLATGTLAVDQPLTINKAGAAHTNSGLILVGGGDLTLSQTGASPSFTTDGTVFVDVGRTWNVSGGAVDYVGGPLGGYGTIALSNVTLGLAATIVQGTLPAFLSVSLTNSTVNGQGTLAVAVGNTLTLAGTTVNVPLVNFGTVEARPAASLLNGPLTNAPGALLRLNGNNGFADVTVASGFTNGGSIELTGTSWAGRLTVGSPTLATLVNAAGATLLTTGGTGNVLTAVLDNQGTVFVGGPLTLNAASAGHSNSGLVQLSGGDLNVQFSSGRPGFSNFGVIDVGANKMVVAGPASAFINQNSGTLQGSGTFDVTGTSFITNGATVVGKSPGAGVLTFVGPYTQGPGTPNPSLLKVDVDGDPLKPGVDFDQIQVSDNIDIQGGTLDVTLGTLVSKQTYVIMQVPSNKTITGDFSIKNGLGQCSSGVSGTAYVIVCP